jgi:hypothetical protein
MKKLFPKRASRRSLTVLCVGCCLAFFAATPHAQAQAPKQSAPTPIEVDSGTLDSYQGAYAAEANPDIIYSFFHEGANFYAEGTRTARTQLFAETKTTFFAKESPARFVFATDPSGKVTGVNISVGPNSRLAKRIGDHPIPNHFRPYDRQEVMIPMRDGIKLHAVILRPTDTIAPLPFILHRTPY